MNISYAYLETTNFCNLACKFCNRDDVVDKLTHMSVDQFSELLRQIKHQPITEAKLMGMGEPFMHPKFDVICKLFKDTFPKCNLISSTNGQIKLGPMFKRALSFIDMCYISIDGYKETYEDIRTGAKWSKLVQFLTELSEFKDEVNCQFPINYTVVPANVNDIEQMFDLISTYKLGELRLNFVQDWSENKRDAEINGFTESQLTYLKQFKEYFKGKSSWNYSDCMWIKSGLYITASGDMKVCCMNTSTRPIGNVFTQPIQLLLHSDRITSIRHGCNSNKPTTHCENCSYKELSPFLTRLHED